MTTEPGLLPKHVDVLDYEKLPKGLCVVIDQVGSRMKKLEQYITNESFSKKKGDTIKGIEIMAKEDL